MGALSKATIDDIDVHGKRVLLREDLNVPMRDGVISDDRRIREAIPTIEALRSRNARVIVVAHLGRPKGRIDDTARLGPIAARLSSLLGADVRLASDVVGDSAHSMVESLRDGDVGMLENVRFEPGETKNDEQLSQQLAGLCDIYVNDAFGSAHRAHSSTEGITRYAKTSVAGFLLAREVEALSKILEHPERPLVAVLGGSKVTDKIGVIDRFLELADTVLIGGAMCFPFFRVQGHSVGSSLCEEEGLDAARGALERGGAKLVLPSDLGIGESLEAGAERRDTDGVDVPDGWMGLDIGPRTAERYAELIRAAGTVFWNGPMGVFETPPFDAGTRTVAQAVADCPGTTVAGGGDSVAALAKFGLTDRVTHVSTGGGATLELVEGRTLPGVAALG